MYYEYKPFRKSSYNRLNAVNYAIKYALTSNPAYSYLPITNGTSGDCTNFVSQCLKAGGALMSRNPPHMWWYNNNAWSVSWAVAHSLYWYLKTNNSIYNSSPKGLEITDLDKLELGDVVFYENFKSIIFHCAIITSFITVNGIREPLISQHSYPQLNSTYKKKYAYKRVHFFKISI